MKQFIKIQYTLYKQNKSKISFEKIKTLANIYMSEEERKELFIEEYEQSYTFGNI